MASAVSEMSEADRYLQDDDPDLLEAQGLTEEIRGKELLRAYKLRKKVEGRTPEAADAIIKAWAQGTGRSAGAWKADLKWAFAIDPNDLLDVFNEEDIGQGEWTQRIGTSHLGVIARAKHQDSNLLLTSRERAEWVLKAYHANLGVDQLKEMLADHNLLRAKKGVKIQPTKNLTACQLGIAMFTDLQKRGVDIDLGILPGDWGKPRKVVTILEKLTHHFRQLYRDTEFAPKTEPGAPKVEGGTTKESGGKDG